MTWADAMGLVVHRGPDHPRPGAHRASGRRSSAPSRAQLKTAISVGIGLFIALIGLVDAGFVRRDRRRAPVPVELGVGGYLAGWPTLVFVVGLLLIAVLMVRKVKGAILIGIVVATVLAIIVEAIAKIGPSVVPGQTRTRPAGA